MASHRIGDERLSAHAVPVSESVFSQCGVTTAPTLVLINRDGRVAKFNPGELTAEELEPLIRRLIASPSF